MRRKQRWPSEVAGAAARSEPLRPLLCRSQQGGGGGGVAGCVWVSETWEWEERNVFYSG